MKPTDNAKSVAWMIPAATAAYSAIQGIGADDRQVNQQERLNEGQVRAAKELADYAQQKQLETWNATNYEAQVKHLKNAGLNPGLIYGMGGAGGATTGSGGGGMPSGGQAANSAQQKQADTGMGMMLAQQGLIAAQTENVKADTAKKLAEAPNITADTATKEFTNALNNLITKEGYMDNWISSKRKLATESEKTMAEWEAFKAANFAGKSTDNPESPLAKAMSAGLETTLQQLQLAKTTNDIAKAEAVIKQFTAKLTQEGIAEGSPWYVKMVGDLLNKAGININQTTADTIK